jgi:UDP-N-acetylglucosamine 2-epimerase (non-hydrolysing)
MNTKNLIIILAGTRPEALKLVPLALLLKKNKENFIFCTTGQHTKLISIALEPFGIFPDVEISLDRKGSELYELTSLLFEKIGRFFQLNKPSLCVVQGDTTTAFVGAMVSFYNNIPVAHIEAGLRTNEINSPFPEELNRRLISQLSTIDFPPTEIALNNLLNQGKNKKNVLLVGNTIVDTLLITLEMLRNENFISKYVSKEVIEILKLNNIILFTSHRRENLGEPMRRIALALQTILKKNKYNIVFPYHPNPVILSIFKEIIGNTDSIHFIESQNYPSFIQLLNHSQLVVTDSGGVQEECATIGKPLIVIRNETERMEAITDCEIQLVGTDTEKIINSIELIMSNPIVRKKLEQKRFPFGNGTSSQKIYDFFKLNKKYEK